MSKYQRHQELLGLLKERDFWVAHELASSLNVGLRTLMRDLSELIENGIPIETERGRGGGIRLHRNYGLGKLQMNSEEIMTLLLSLATMEKLKTPLLMNNLTSIRRKLFQTFPLDQRERLTKISKRVVVGNQASSHILETYELPKSSIIEPLHQAFFASRRLQIKYMAENGRSLERVIEPHYLLLNWPIWYVLAWDQLRSDVRFFRIDRIQKIREVKEDFVERINVFEPYLKDFFTPI